MDVTALLVCVLALAYSLGAGLFVIHPVAMEALPLVAADPQEPAMSGTGFAPGAVFQEVAPPPSVRGIELYGSATQGDKSTGVVQTRWYRPAPNVFLYVCGYPLQPGEQLFLELFSPLSGTRRVALSFDENPENWKLQKISAALLNSAARFRMVASDKSSQQLGWMGFSQPFTIRRTDKRELLKQLGLLLLCTAACIVALLGPGLVLKARSKRPVSAVWLPIPGILVMTALGLLAWRGPPRASPEIISRVGLAIVFLAVGSQLLRRSVTTILDPAELRAVAYVVLLIVVAVAKSLYSLGPSGELYGGQISRTLEASSRGDSRIPYHLVQLIALRRQPYSDLANTLFSPWNFSHRGPIAGLAASPIALCADVHPPDSRPAATWTVFDSQGFMSYRVAMIALSGGSLLVLFGLARTFLPAEWALFAFACAASAPFTVHELFFTWPKVLAASFVLLAAYLVGRQRCLAAGLSVGFGYLCHPSALLFFPAILMLIVIDLGPLSALTRPKLARWAVSSFLACLGLAAWILIWRWVNDFHFRQEGFFEYFLQAGGLSPTLTNWFRSRWTTTVKTLVPLYVFLFHRTDLDLLPPARSPQPYVQFVAQYWCTLAFAGGCLFYLPFLRLVAAGLTSAKAYIWLVFAPSFALFAAYFGAPNTGLMREGLHAWFFGLLLFAFVMWNRNLAASKQLWLFVTGTLALRGIELLCVLIPFPSWSRGFILQPPFVGSDLLALTTMLLGTLLLFINLVAWARATI